MLNDKVALVTGAARGIGFEIGKRFAEAGAIVILTDKDGSGAAEAAERLRSSGLRADGMRLDVTSEEEIAGVVGYADDRYGRLDVLINNAGMQHVAPVEQFPTEKFEQMIRLMLTAPFMAIKHALPLMKRQSFGRIINIASINGIVGFAGKAAYNSAKHGVIGLTKAVALETAPYGITANALCPGYADTELVSGQLADLAAARHIPVQDVLDQSILSLVPQRRLLDVSEIAEYALFLAGEAARGVTGQAIVIDGGYTAQ